MSGEKTSEKVTAASVGSTALLGDGADLAGRSVEYWGHVWTITAQNNLGDWNVERFEEREDGRYRIRSSIAPHVLPTFHPHFARLVDSPNVGLTDLLDGWRLIAEELPPNETPVWLWDGTHCFIGEHVYDGGWWLFAKCFHVPWWDQDYGWRADDSETDDYAPTHWRPLPQPPNRRWDTRKAKTPDVIDMADACQALVAAIEQIAAPCQTREQRTALIIGRSALAALRRLESAGHVGDARLDRTEGEA